MIPRAEGVLDHERDELALIFTPTARERARFSDRTTPRMAF